jgi:hypothetical protein
MVLQKLRLRRGPDCDLIQSHLILGLPKKEKKKLKINLINVSFELGGISEKR